MVDYLKDSLPRLELCAHKHQCSVDELVGHWLDIDDKYDIDNLVLFAQVLKEMPANLLVTDPNQPDNPIIYASQECEATTGYAPQELLKQNPRIFRNGDNDQPALDLLRDSIAQSQACHVVLRNYRKDGTPFENEIYLKPLFDDQGQLTHFVAIQHDLSAREIAIRDSEKYNADLAVRRSEERFRMLIETAPGAILLVDAAGHIVLVNARGEAMFGYTRDELVGVAIDALLPEGYVTHPSARPMGRDLAGRRKDGTEFPVEIGLSYTTTEEGLLTLVFVTDITERKRAEDALRQSQERLRLVTDNILDMIMQADENGIVQYVSPSVQEVWGVSPDNIIGTNLSKWLELLYPDDHAILADVLTKRLATGSGPDHWTYRFLHEPGQFRWLEHRVSSFTKEDGSLGGFIYVIRDVNERVIANTMLQKADELFSKVFHASPIGISISTVSDGRYVDGNEAFIKMYGFENKASFIGKTYAELDTWDLRNLQPKEPFFYPFHHQSGDRREALCSAEIIELSGEEFILSMFQDVTAQKKTEAELELHRQHLEVLVAARTAELAELNQQLQREVADRRIAEAAEHEQRLLAEALCNIAVALNMQVELNGVLDEIMTNIGNIISHDAVSLILLHEETAQLVRSHGFADSDMEIEDESIPISELQISQIILHSQRPLLIPDAVATPPLLTIAPPFKIGSYLGVPLVNASEIIGIINIFSRTPNQFTETNLSQIEMFAEQATVAIHKAQLHKQTKEIAIWRERQQIARNLHDAVTQTIFAASIITETILKIWGTEPHKVYDGLVQLQRLIRGAVAESRNLLFELRPEALEDAKLSRLLPQLADSFEGKTGIRPAINIPAEVQLPREVKVALYWITHEALTNIEKHAEATEISIGFTSSHEHVNLVITDNGRGFANESIQSTHLGLRIMRERAESVNAQMEVVSEPNRGTVISINWEGSQSGQEN